jgi:hypothetical protein
MNTHMAKIKNVPPATHFKLEADIDKKSKNINTCGVKFMDH